PRQSSRPRRPPDSQQFQRLQLGLDRRCRAGPVARRVHPPGHSRQRPDPPGRAALFATAINQLNYL
ncbi:hypothetical protein HK405_000582, partial [Cladochytrium tenue]